MNQTETISKPVPKKRDPRLDFFRGIGMFIIFMAHTPGNWFTLYIPARFGFSDATEIFVFCSGMASAIAFGKVFKDISWLMGAMRIAHRIWQVYWAHIGLFFATLVLMIIQTKIAASGIFCDYNADRLCDLPGNESWDYVGRLNIIHIFKETGGSPAWDNFLGIMTLTWVPNLFDILPMYIVILAMIPVIMGLYKLAGKWAAMGLVVLMWLGAQDGIGEFLGFSHGLHLPAEPWSDREWFFNPFGWQLVFFTGFAFMMGWLPKPPVKWWLVLGSALIVLAYVPFAFWGIYRDPNNFVMAQEASRSLFGVESLSELVREPFYTDKFTNLEPWTIFNVIRINFWEFMEKTDVGILRYMHFLFLAYVFWALAGEGGKRLDFKNFIGRYFVKIVHKVGQQSLAVFLASIVLARFAGFIFDIIGKGWPKMIAVNLAGLIILVGVAYLVSWLKKVPWKVTKPTVTLQPAQAERITGI